MDRTSGWPKRCNKALRWFPNLRFESEKIKKNVQDGEDILGSTLVRQSNTSCTED